jgi:hypothetical protein
VETGITQKFVSDREASDTPRHQIKSAVIYVENGKLLSEKLGRKKLRELLFLAGLHFDRIAFLRDNVGSVVVGNRDEHTLGVYVIKSFFHNSAAVYISLVNADDCFVYDRHSLTPFLFSFLFYNK